MSTNISVHVYDKLEVTQNVYKKDDSSEVVNITIRVNDTLVDYFMNLDQQKNFIDKLCKATYGTSYSEHLQEVDNLVAAIDSKNDTIEELEKRVDMAFDENLRLEDIISNLKCDLSTIRREE